MKSSAYFQKLRDPRWQRKRLEVMERDQFACRLCGDSKSTLNVHHLFYTRGADPWDYSDTALVTTCEYCHEELHLCDFGPKIIEALIAGGADMSALHGVMNTIIGTFNEGPSPITLDSEKWVHAEGAMFYALKAIANGASESDVRSALERFLEA